MFDIFGPEIHERQQVRWAPTSSYFDETTTTTVGRWLERQSPCFINTRSVLPQQSRWRRRRRRFLFLPWFRTRRLRRHRGARLSQSTVRSDDPSVSTNFVCMECDFYHVECCAISRGQLSSQRTAPSLPAPRTKTAKAGTFTVLTNPINQSTQSLRS